VYRLADKISIKGPRTLAVAGSLGCLRGSVEAPEAARLISQVRFERLQCLPRSITFEQHLWHRRSETRSSSIRLFCLCAERRPNCRCEAVLRLFQVIRVPDDGGQVVGIEVRALFLPSAFLASVDHRPTQTLAKARLPVGARATMR